MPPVPPSLELVARRIVEADELRILDLSLAALEEAIEEAGNTRRGRALKRQAAKLRRAIACREDQRGACPPQTDRKKA